jgi:O-antigen ligase
LLTALPTQANAAAMRARRRDPTLIFAAGTLLLSLLLQRFAVPVGSQGVDVVGPLALMLALWALLTGALSLHRPRLILFGALALWTLLGAAWQTVHPNSYGVGLTLQSLAQFLLLTVFCVLSFSHEVDERSFFRGAATILALIAAAGILQFLLQFIGLGLFSFTHLLPDRMLFESGYNLEIPVGIGDILKSNGFFLLEPSIFSQCMAMGLILEILATRRPWFLALFAAGLLLSFSGTGWIVLVSFLVSVGARLGRRGVLLAAGLAVAIVTVFAAIMYFSPDTADVFAGRFAEFSQPGTSGNLRFTTPFQLMNDVLAREPTAWLFGIGPGASERLSLAYEYDVNTPIKILLEYGLPAVVLYVAIFLTAQRTKLQGALVVPCLVLVLLAGGYQEFAPVLFPILLLLCVARLRPSAP